MAITRAQQAKQMLQKGGRIGLKKGSDDKKAAATREARRTSQYTAPKRSTFSSEIEDEIFTPGPGGGNDRDEVRTLREGIDEDGRPTQSEITERQKQKYINQFTSKGKVPPGPNRKRRQRALNYLNRNMLIDYNRLINPPTKMLSPTGYPNYGIPNLYQGINEALESGRTLKEILETGNRIPVGLSGSYEANPIPDLDIDSIRELAAQQSKFGSLTGFQADALEDLRETINKRDDLINTGDTSDIFPDQETFRNPDNKVEDPCLGPNPPAYCFPKEEDPEDETPKRNLAGLTPRIGGGIFDFTEFAADGGRIGLRGGKDASKSDFKTPSAASQVSRADPRDVGFNVKDAQTSKQYGDGITPTDDSGRIVTPKEVKTTPKEKKSFNVKDFLKTTKKKTQPLRDFLFLRDLVTGNIPGAAKNLALQFAPISQTGIATPNLATGNIVYDERLGFIDATTGNPVDTTMPDARQIKTYSTEDVKNLLGIKDKPTAEKFVTDPVFGGPEFIDEKGQANIMDKFRENLLEQETKFPNKPFDVQRSAAKTLGISPTNRSLIPSDFLDEPGQAATQTPFEDVAEDIVREYDLAEGGIAGIDREEFLLGGIVKGLKKAVRGVKKIAKSPIGKVALLAAGAGYGGFGPLKGLFSGVKGAGFLKSMAVNKSLLGTADYMGGPTGILDLIKEYPMASIFGASALAGLATPKQDGFDLDSYYADGRLNPNAPLNTRIAGSEFDFYGGQRAADGGRIGYQEGSKEPVAKKTMPLLDMEGMEKDYRETGGFVPIGRMEKADDVPARLSKNEFVFTADAVRNAGDGDIDKGSEVMYNMMKNLEAGGEVSEESQGLDGARKMFQTSQRLEEVL